MASSVTDTSRLADPSLYRPHGQSRIWTEPRLLVVHTRGPWNRELVRQASDIVLKHAREFNGQPWMALGIIYGDGLHTPDAFDEMVASLRAQRQAGRSGTALVLADVGQTGFFRDYFTRMYATGGEPLEFFANEADARSWLASKILALP